MLEHMSKESIFDIELAKDIKTLTFTEACDHYYSTRITKSELIELVSDLQTIADQMEE